MQTLADQDGPRESMEQQRLNDWSATGGSAEDNVLSPAALYITAILESVLPIHQSRGVVVADPSRHVCEHVLSALSRVMGRDSGKSSASVEDLFTAVAEDDSIWGFFTRMNGKSDPPIFRGRRN